MRSIMSFQEWKITFFQPRKLPTDSKFIRFHDNVAIAADVTFVNHDVIYLACRNLDKR